MGQTDSIALIREDPDLAPVVEQLGPVTLEPAEDPFERFLTAIVRQQVSMAAAAAINERLADAIEVTPAAILAADRTTLREAGLSEAKTDYAKAIATVWQERGYDRSYFEALSDEAVVSELTDIHGVGDWTAKMFLMFCLGREDVFPVEDLGIRKGMWRFVDEDLGRAAMRERASEWTPYRSYASLYLWRGVENDL
ncbi:MAG: DNA-3-methyladenine glycosylase 2 family protein [Haloarculaceae archaeon]